MKLTNKKTAFLLGIVLAIALVLRLWNLSSTPPSLDWDEVSWGYNAYSILTTGKDEYGKSFPIVIQSFDDYKPALYAYLLLPFIFLFGLSDFVVRFPNALFGALSVLTTYLLVKELFKRNDLSLLSSFLMAISPWSIQFSRYSHEGIIGLEFNLLMILFFLKGLKKPWFMSLSAAFAAMSLYSYQNEKLIVPLLGIVLLLVFWRDLLKVPLRYLAYALSVGAVMALPIVIFTFTNPNSFTRAKGASFMNNPVGVLNTQFYPKRNLIDRESGDYAGIIFDNRRVAYAKDVFENYLLHFDLNNLFVTGDKVSRHQPPGMGHLYFIELPFLLLGLYMLIFGKFSRKVKALIIGWMLIVPIPASVTWDVPNAGRTLNFLPTFQILTAIGLISAFSYLRLFKRWVRGAAIGLFAAAVLFNFSYYLNQYFVQYSYFNSQDFQYGYKGLIPYILEVQQEYDRVIVSNQVPLDQSYIFFLYHLRYPPQEYQKVSSDGTYKSGHRFDRYVFRGIENSEADTKTLYVVGADVYLDLPDKKILKILKFRNGEDAIVVYSGK